MGQRFALPYCLPKPSHTAGTLYDIFIAQIIRHSAPSMARGIYEKYFLRIKNKSGFANLNTQW
jgi:hypothetical protein